MKKRRKQLTLKRGGEILLNGFIVRAIGPENAPDSLCISHPNTWHIDENKHTPKKHIYAGIRDNVLCSSTMCVGLVGNLTAGDGIPAQTAREYLAHPLPPELPAMARLNDDSQAKRIGEKIVELLNLKPIRGRSTFAGLSMYETEWGTKTSAGLARMLAAILTKKY